MKYIISILASFTLLILGCGNGETVEIDDIGEREEIVITDHTMGCFLNPTIRYIFSHGGVVRMWEEDIEQYNDPEVWGYETVLKYVGSTVLTKEELSQLKEYIHFYRKKKEGGSSLRIWMDVQYRRDSLTIGFENLSDSSGGGPNNKLNFYTLEVKIRESNKSEQVAGGDRAR